MLKSPLNYAGCKYKLLKQILPIFPELTDLLFFDLFGGSGTVLVNTSSKKAHYNELDFQIFSIIKKIIESPIDSLLETITAILEEFNLSKNNKKAYYSFRDFFNSSVELKDREIFLFILSCHSFSNIIRFNFSGKYNVPFGHRTFNEKTRENLIFFKKSMVEKEIFLSNLSYDEVIIPGKSFIYCDPPYLNSNAVYSGLDSWNYEEELKLRSYLEKLNKPWALSNDFEVNPSMESWALKKGFNIHELNYDYSNSFYCTKRLKNKTREVLITNYSQ